MNRLLYLSVLLLMGFNSLLAQPYDSIDLDELSYNWLGRWDVSNWGDVNGDGTFDVAAAGPGAGYYALPIFVSNASGSYDLFREIGDLVYPRIEFRDFDNDNIPEIFTAGPYIKDPYDNRQTGSAVRIYKYSGSSISSYYEYDIGGEEIDISGCADYDRDGDMDFHFDGKVFQNTNGDFNYIHKHKSEFPDIEWSDDVPLYKSADMDGDGDLDSLSNSMVYINQAGPSGFEKPTVPVSDREEYSIELNEALFWWDPSTDPDSPSDSISYNLRLGTRTRVSNVVSPSAEYWTGFKRTANRGNMGFYDMPARISNLKTGTTYYWSVQAVDIDGLSSIFSAERSFLYSGFQLEPGRRYDSRISGICLPVDMDRDTDFEFFCGTFIPSLWEYEYDIWPHIADTTFNVEMNLDFGEISFVSHASLADFNNDGNIDILARDNLYRGYNWDTSVPHIYRNNGTSSFGQLDLPVSRIEGSVLASSVSKSDFDNDGYQDILILSHNSTYLLENQGNFQFEIIDSLQLIAVDSGFATWSDYDNDLDEDLFISGVDSYGNNICRLYRNDDSNFTSVATNIIALANGSADWGDYDNDGDMDLLITGNDNSGIPTTRVYQNNQTQFNQITTDFIGVGYSRYVHPVYNDPKEQRSFCRWGDFDNDGFLDLVVYGADPLEEHVSEIYRNNGDGGFDLLPSGFRKCRAGSLMIGDIYDHDGDLDIIFTGQSGADQFADGADEASSYRNLYGQNMIPSQATNLSSKTDGFEAVLYWDPASDQESGDHLSYNIRLGSAPGGIDIVSPMSLLSTGKRLIVEHGNTGTNRSWLIKELPVGTYYWSVQAIDQSYNGGAWAPEQSFTISNLKADFKADTACFGTQTSFTDQTFSTEIINTWYWEFGDGGGTSSEKDPFYTYGTYGEFEVSLTVSTASYQHQVTKTVTVKPTAIPDFTSAEVCEGESTIFSNSTNTGGLSVSSWLWQFGDDSPDFTGQDPPAHKYLAGVYEVRLEVVADNACESFVIKEVLVGNMPSEVLNINGEQEFCTGDSVQLIAESHPNYKYEWRLNNVPILDHYDNVLTVYESGLYKAQITNSIGLCTAISHNYAVAATPLPSVPEIASENYVMGNCPFDDPVIMSIQNPPDQAIFQWKKDGRNITGEVNSSYMGFLEEGNYSVEANITGCSVESDFFIIEYGEMPEKPYLIVNGPNVWYLACNNDAAQSYRWHLNDELIVGADSYLHVAGNTYGKYQVSISDGGDCYAASDPVWIPLSTGIEEKLWENLKIYPNPSPGVFSIEMNNPIIGDLIIDIFSDSGSKILNIKFQKETSHFRTEIDLSSQASGVYLIGLLMDKNQTTRKIVVE